MANIQYIDRFRNIFTYRKTQSKPRKNNRKRFDSAITVENKFFIYPLIAAFCSYLAYQTLYGKWESHWLEHNRPEFKLWNFTLRSMGFESVENTTVLDRVTKLLPRPDQSNLPQWSKINTVWWSKNQQWIVLYLPDAPSRWGEPMVYTRQKIQKQIFKEEKNSKGNQLRLSKELRTEFPKNWEIMGGGWNGYGNLIDRISNAEFKTQYGFEKIKPKSNNKAPKSNLRWRDPREFVY